MEVEYASEFRYRDPVLEPGGLSLFISQSGETADTLAALRHCKHAGQTIAVVVNVPTSSMAREADLLLPTHAGPEIGVASTKAFTCQLAVLAALAANLARAKGKFKDGEEREIVKHLAETPAALNALNHRSAISKVVGAPGGPAADFRMALCSVFRGLSGASGDDIGSVCSTSGSCAPSPGTPKFCIEELGHSEVQPRFRR